MSALSHLPGFVLAACMVIIIPGPATLLVADRARQSRACAVSAVAGIVTGDVLLITLSASGFAVVMQGLPWLLPALRLLGAAYLLYLGLTLLRSASQTATSQRVTEHIRASFRRGLLITISNPKPILFFSSFFPLFIDSGSATPVHSFILYGILFEIINLFYFLFLCSIIAFSKHLQNENALPRSIRLLPAVSVQKFCALGLLLCGTTMAASLFWHAG